MIDEGFFFLYLLILFFQYFRSQYNHEIEKVQKSQRSGAGTDDVFDSSTYWFEKMNFLKTFIKPRKGKSNVENVRKLINISFYLYFFLLVNYVFILFFIFLLDTSKRKFG